MTISRARAWMSSRSGRPFAVVSAVLVALSGCGGTSEEPPPAADPGAAVEAREDYVSLARAAYARGDFLEPPGNNAVYFYRIALGEDPEDPAAQAGLEQVVRSLLAEADEAFGNGDLKRAHEAILSARLVDPHHSLVAEYEQRLLHEREGAVIRQAWAVLADGELEQAARLLADAVSINPDGSEDQERLRGELAAREARALHAGWLGKANVRIADGMLFTPARDSAVYHIRAVLAQDRDNRQARQMLAQVQRLALAGTRAALDGGQLDDAAELLAGLEGVAPRNAEAAELRHRLLAAREAAAERAALQRLLADATQALEAGRLDGPEDDDARSLLALVEARDAAFPGLAELAARLDEALAAEAEAARAAELAAQQAAAAADGTVEVPAMARADAAPPEPAPIVPEGLLERRRFFAPQYPLTAERRQTEGWVELQFTVDTDGRPRDILVTDSEPPSVFEDNAVRALQRWRYEPVERDGELVEQRARVRIVFRLPE